MTMILLRGRRTLTSFRLWTRAPLMKMLSSAIHRPLISNCEALGARHQGLHICGLLLVEDDTVRFVVGQDLVAGFDLARQQGVGQAVFQNLLDLYLIHI